MVEDTTVDLPGGGSEADPMSCFNGFFEITIDGRPYVMESDLESKVQHVFFLHSMCSLWTGNLPLDGVHSGFGNSFQRNNGRR